MVTYVPSRPSRLLVAVTENTSKMHPALPKTGDLGAADSRRESKSWGLRPCDRFWWGWKCRNGGGALFLRSDAETLPLRKCRDRITFSITSIIWKYNTVFEFRRRLLIQPVTEVSRFSQGIEPSVMMLSWTSPAHYQPSLLQASYLQQGATLFTA